MEKNANNFSSTDEKKYMNWFLKVKNYDSFKINDILLRMWGRKWCDAVRLILLKGKKLCFMKNEGENLGVTQSENNMWGRKVYARKV